MAASDLLFYATGAAMLALGLATVLARNLFRAALSLLGVLWCTAMLFLLLKAEMVALVQVMVYIGGILIFVLYAVLLTSELGGSMPRPSLLKSAGGLAAAGMFLTLLLSLARWSREAEVDVVGPGAPAPVDNLAPLKGIGLRLLDPGPQGFLVPFEIISLILLAALVGAISLARQAPERSLAPTRGERPAARGQAEAEPAGEPRAQESA